ncbi:hypothetical protein C8R43DRAFT_965362 [Mycena crocata]|nr:hypothetical protein C8R43DRAFT_965362 [Mycena crocata]
MDHFPNIGVRSAPLERGVEISYYTVAAREPEGATLPPPFELVPHNSTSRRTTLKGGHINPSRSFIPETAGSHSEIALLECSRAIERTVILPSTSAHESKGKAIPHQSFAGELEISRAKQIEGQTSQKIRVVQGMINKRNRCDGNVHAESNRRLLARSGDSSDEVAGGDLPQSTGTYMHYDSTIPSISANLGSKPFRSSTGKQSGEHKKAVNGDEAHKSFVNSETEIWHSRLQDPRKTPLE